MPDPADETVAAEEPREFNGYAITCAVCGAIAAIAILLGIAGLLEHLVTVFTAIGVVAAVLGVVFGHMAIAGMAKREQRGFALSLFGLIVSYLVLSTAGLIIVASMIFGGLILFAI